MAAKDTGIRIRVEKELRAAFHNACKSENREASEVLREFMRSYADKRAGGKQTSLFNAQAMRTRRRKKVGPQREA